MSSVGSCLSVAIQTITSGKRCGHTHPLLPLVVVLDIKHLYRPRLAFCAVMLGVAHVAVRIITRTVCEVVVVRGKGLRRTAKRGVICKLAWQ